MGQPICLPSIFLGLSGFRVLAVDEDDGELFVLVETDVGREFCRTCGVRAGSKGRARVQVRDIPSSGRPVRLVWRKRRWRCEQPECPPGSWTETHDAVRPRAVLTERARMWACEQVGRLGRPVACVARELGVGWPTVMDDRVRARPTAAGRRRSARTGDRAGAG